MPQKFNFKPIDRLSGFEYDNFILRQDVKETVTTPDGNLYVIDKDNHLFNVHPLTSFRYNKEKGENESIAPSYPVRWQVTGSYNVPSQLTDRIG